MLNINMYDAKTNLSKYAKLLEDKLEDEIIISRSGKPIMVLSLYKKDVKRVFGCAKGMFEVPDDFDDMDMSELFEGKF